MQAQPSLVTRVAVGKLVGLALGVVAFVLTPELVPDADPYMRWGFLFWYMTVGAMIGLAGVFEHHPVFGVPLPWYVRGPAIAAWMNLVLALMAHGEFARVVTPLFGELSPGAVLGLSVAEGLVVGALIGGLATRFGGEGPATVAR